MFMGQTNTLTRQFWSFNNRLFICKGNHSSINHTHLPMHIHKLIHYCSQLCKQNRSDPQIITLNNHINKQIHEHKTLGNNILTKLIANTIHTSLWGTITKLSNKKPPTQQNRSIYFKT